MAHYVTDAPTPKFNDCPRRDRCLWHRYVSAMSLLSLASILLSSRRQPRCVLLSQIVQREVSPGREFDRCDTLQGRLSDYLWHHYPRMRSGEERQSTLAVQFPRKRSALPGTFLTSKDGKKGGEGGWKDTRSRNGSPRIPDNYTRLVKRQMLSRIIGENFDLPRTRGICIRGKASAADGHRGVGGDPEDFQTGDRLDLRFSDRDESSD